MNALREAAHRYSSTIGWRVFPCVDKRPLTCHGLLDASADPATIEEWWRRWPHANVAIRTGAASGLLVLDDDTEGEAVRDLEAQHEPLPRTASVKTPRGGAHYYFRHPGGTLANSAGALAHGLDIRGDGGYVIAPPSTGANGRRYEPDDQAPVAVLPEWLRRLVSGSHNGRGRGSRTIVGVGRYRARASGGAAQPRGRAARRASARQGRQRSARRRARAARQQPREAAAARSGGRPDRRVDRRTRTPQANRGAAMSAVATLAATQNGNGALDPAETLAALLDLASVNVSILGVRTFGQGSRAAVEIALSNGDTMCFDTIRDLTRPANLAAELVACAGVLPKLNQARALQVAALVRKLADRETTLTDNEIAADWGASYLQAAEMLDVDLNEQAQRWAAFCRLEQHDPLARSRENGGSIASTGIVLRHQDGSRLVRAGWFFQHVRTLDSALSQSTLGTRMARVGWTRRGGSGRIKATAPGRQGTLGWNFWTVPTAWEHDR